MIIFSLVAMTGLEKCCITSAYLQWQCHSGERPWPMGLLFQAVLIRNLTVYRYVIAARLSEEHNSHPMESITKVLRSWNKMLSLAPLILFFRAFFQETSM